MARLDLDKDVPRPPRQITATAATLATFAALHVVAGLITVVVTSPSGTLAASYSLNQGVSAGFAARATPHSRPVFLAGTALGTLAVRVAMGTPASTSAVFAVANTAGAGLFAWLTTCVWPTTLALHDLTQVHGFVQSALVAAAVPAAVIAGGLHVLDPSAPELWRLWLLRGLADLTGILSGVPLVVLAPGLRHLSRRQWLHLAVFGAAILVVATTGPAGLDRWSALDLYVPVALLLVAVVMLGRPAAAVLPLLIVPLAVLGTATGESAIAERTASPLMADTAIGLFNVTTLAAAWLASAVVSERSHASGRIERSEERFRAIFTRSPLGVVVVTMEPDSPGRILMANPSFCALVGYREDELAGRRGIELLHPDDAARSGEIARRWAHTGDHPRQVELRHVRGDGTVVWLRIVLSTLNDDQGRRLGLAQAEDVTAARQAAEDIERHARYDDLTGLANRSHFMERLRVALDGLSHQPGCVAVIYADLDRFKEINDALGHEAGDIVLSEVARRVRSTVRAVDTPARLAADELAIVCPGISDTGAALVILERIRAALREPVELAGGSLTMTASFGLAVADSPAADRAELLRRADAALTQAKRNGRDRYEIYDETLRARVRHRHHIQQDLRDALAHDWFRLHYQPIIDLRTGSMTSVEALLRLDHPDRGLLGPDAFIEVAEDCELILPIGDWVLRQACRQAAWWNEQLARAAESGPDPGPLGVAVNVSGRQTASRAITPQVLAAAADAHLDPARLRVEVTERVLIEGGERVVDDLRELTNNHHVSLAIDDFGTGYSSLTYLKHFPVDTVKIDRSFVAGVGASHRDTAIVEAVTALADSLRLTVVAEGVETPTQLAHLLRLGCGFAQGYYFARPAAADTITELLGSGEPIVELDGAGGARQPAFFAWDDSYELGHRDIDTQHRGIVECVDRLHRTLSSGGTQAAARTLFDTIRAQTAAHFTFEEELMRRTEYEGLDAHAAEHRRLIEGVAELREDLEANALTMSLEVVEFLRDWFVVHIDELDAPLVRHLDRFDDPRHRSA